jgi:predicted transcriptional regulator
VTFLPNALEAPGVGTRRPVTISLPPQLLKDAERIAAQENRTKSELLREALRFYIDTSEVRRRATRERLFAFIDGVQSRTKGIEPRGIRKLVREAVDAARRTRRRATA